MELKNNQDDNAIQLFVRAKSQDKQLFANYIKRRFQTNKMLCPQTVTDEKPIDYYLWKLLNMPKLNVMFLVDSNTKFCMVLFCDRTAQACGGKFLALTEGKGESAWSKSFEEIAGKAKKYADQLLEEAVQAKVPAALSYFKATREQKEDLLQSTPLDGSYLTETSSEAFIPSAPIVEEPGEEVPEGSIGKNQAEPQKSESKVYPSIEQNTSTISVILSSKIGEKENNSALSAQEVKPPALPTIVEALQELPSPPQQSLEILSNEDEGEKEGPPAESKELVCRGRTKNAPR